MKKTSKTNQPGKARKTAAPPAHLKPKAFALDAAGGQYDEQQLAERHGITSEKVFQILSGRSHPRLAARIADLSADRARVAWDRLRRLQGKAVSTLSLAMADKAPPAALAAAKEVIGCTMKSGSRRGRPDRPSRPHRPRPPKLTPEQIRQLELDLDGPPAGDGGPQG